MSPLLPARRRLFERRWVPLALALLTGLGVKGLASASGADGLRWILGPTTALVEMTTGLDFEFESRAGYINRDIRFLIAPSCAGVNFLVMAFCMLACLAAWRLESPPARYAAIPAAAVVAFLSAVLANSLRVLIAIQMLAWRPSLGWLDAPRLHRMEGILVYFGFLLGLFVLGRRVLARRSRLFAAATGVE